MALTAHLVGGPRDGETHEVELVGNRLLFVGNLEDRKPVTYEDGTSGYAYPKVTYGMRSQEGNTAGENLATFVYEGTSF